MSKERKWAEDALGKRNGPRKPVSNGMGQGNLSSMNADPMIAIMSSPAEKKGKGKVPARDYPQNKRLPAMRQSFEKHEGASSTSHRGATSLQPMYPEMVTYSSAFMAITLERVRKRTL